MDIDEAFSKWIDAALSANESQRVVAYNFNLYEGAAPEFHVELIGASEFTKDDEDWACAEVFATRDNLFVIPHDLAGEKWEDGLAFAVKLVRRYLEEGELRDTLKARKAVGVGFVDGNIELVFEKD
jgi:hypothetical protein